jgi:formylglycine-generating enzyme required for sulfatase activity
MNHSAPRYDLFLSYHWRDRDAVESVAKALMARGLRVFLDRWYLAAGQPWPVALEQALGTCRAVAVFLGPNGMGSWQQREKWLALDRQAREPGFPVIPVLLPRAEQLALEFLSLNTWVDLRAAMDDAEALDGLIHAARGEAPGPALSEQLSATLASIAPYRGLGVFREEDAPFFFGRDTFISDALLPVVERRALVAVVGASGSGKSSVVRAGLLPRLRHGDGGKVWEIATLLPSDRPLHALAAALLPLLEPERAEMTETDRLAEVGKLAGYLTAGTVALRDVVARVLEKQPGTERLLLVADQWEEIYTLTQDAAAAQRFITEVLDATAASPLTLVLTLRGDFFGEVLAHRGLADRLQGGVVNLGPMKREEIEAVVVRPAEKVGLTFEPGLPDRILDDVGEEPGHLPLLEFVLTGLWQDRRAGRLLHEGYEAMGGVQGAMAQRAEAVWKDLGDREAPALHRLFLHLVRAGAGTADTRRRAALSELAPAVRSVVEKLARERLLVTGRDEASGEETVEVAHEALIRHWGRLRQWLDEDREFLLWRQRLEVTLAQWERAARKDSGTLLRGAPLAEAARWLAERGDDLNEDERAYVRASLAARDRRRWLAGGAAALVVLASVVAAVWQYREAERLRRERAPILPVMVEIQPRPFMMGSRKDDKEAYSNEQPLHEVVIVKPFKIGKHEVTFEEYDRFALATDRRPPSDQGWGGGKRPVINVSWDDAVAYAKWLSKETGQRFRLPTEAEWEYAARADSATARFWGDDPKEACRYANVYDRTGEAVGKEKYAIDWEAHDCDDGFVETAPVDRSGAKPNALGLHDVLGNVWEWVEDCWHASYEGAPTDGSVWTAGGDCGRRVVRGGSGYGAPRHVRSARRTRLPAGGRDLLIGARLAQDL